MTEQCEDITVMPHLEAYSKVKSVSSNPLGYRLAKKPDGTLILQCAYQWWTEKDSGIEWEEIPTVEVEDE